MWNIYLNCLPAPFPVLGVLRQSPHDEVGLERLRPKDVISGKDIFVNHKNKTIERDFIATNVTFHFVSAPSLPLLQKTCDDRL